MPDPDERPPGADPAPDEQALLDAFDRLSPQGGLPWAFDDAMRRLGQPDLDTTAEIAPWRGLPDDLWERGRSARIGRRFVGDVAGVMADILAADARTAADAALAAIKGDRLVAAWDALRFLAARVEALEARSDPFHLQAAESAWPVPDPAEWSDRVTSWVGGPADGTVIVGESGTGELPAALAGDGRHVVGVEPRGDSVWRALGGSPPDRRPGVETVLGEVAAHLTTVPDRSVDGVVLLGCVDRLAPADKFAMLQDALRATRRGGTVVVLATDPSAWDTALSPPERDLAPGRPFHPETWSMLLGRSGATGVTWHRPVTGTLHAVVAELGP
jgi:hypothetical protein